ncbi:MAG TPA: hypothetical protein VF260_06510 [Bacilli bacterium]
MTPHEEAAFAKFLADSFQDGTSIRELRLSEEEKQFILKTYPRSRVRPFSTDEYADGKTWYQVSLSASSQA